MFTDTDSDLFEVEMPFNFFSRKDITNSIEEEQNIQKNKSFTQEENQIFHRNIDMVLDAASDIEKL